MELVITTQFYIKDLQNQYKLQCNKISPSILIQDFLRNVIILNL
ncbi:hypothetical protein A3Q56_08496 [Intoshia linei]|uniref:Uncharacterized protein n=1 Tax=Intoshia linei TaxID=1819745 RepID=A0A177AQY3_9BILA|nr:hypothetical protein A3Q56_08496 [Intoshia linei]